MAKFKIGDKVKVIKSNYIKSTDLGAVGTVAATLAGSYLVDFHNVREFTWKKMDGGKGTGRVYKESEIALVKETPTQNWKVVILPDGDKTTALYYENGKVSKKAEVKRYFKDDYSVTVALRAVLEKLDLLGEKKSDEKPAFDWKKFIDGDLCVRFSCKKDYVEFLKLCEEKGLKWNHGEKPTKYIEWTENRTLVHNGFKHETESKDFLARMFGVNFENLSMGTTEGDFEELSGRKVPVVDWKSEVEESPVPFKVGDIVELIESYASYPKGTRGKIHSIEEAANPENGYLVNVITGRNNHFTAFATRLKKVK